MGIRAQSLDDWSDYAGRFLGMQQVDHGGGSLAFRMDDWRQRFVIMDEPGDELAFMGWQVDAADDLDDIIQTGGRRCLRDRGNESIVRPTLCRSDDLQMIRTATVSNCLLRRDWLPTCLRPGGRLKGF